MSTPGTGLRTPTRTISTPRTEAQRARRAAARAEIGTLTERARAARTATAKAARTATVKAARSATTTAKAATAAAATKAAGTATAARAAAAARRDAKTAAVKPTSAKATSAKATSAKATSAKAPAAAKAATAPKAATAAKTAAAKPTAATTEAPNASVMTAKAPAPKTSTPKAASPKPTAAKVPAAVKAAAPATVAPKAATPLKAAAPPNAKAAAKAPAESQKPAPVASTETPAPAPAVPAVRRPTPYKRTPSGEAAPALATAAVDVAPVVELPSVGPVGPAESGARTWMLRRRPPSVRRRPALYMTAALVGALSVSAFTSGDPSAQAETATVSHSISVAEQLGLEAEPLAAITDADVTENLEDLTASRESRDADQAAAQQEQATADAKAKAEAKAAAEAAAKAAAEAARPDAVAPVKGARLTSGFGARWGTLHAGIDLAAPMMTPEYAVMDGVVLEAGPAGGYGNAVYVQHGNGDVTVYGHMEQILVSAGQVVKAGETIALLGNRGQSTGPHLHFEVHVGGLNGQKIDPIPWLRDRGVKV